MSQLPSAPPEFFTPAELEAMLGHGRKRVIAALDAAGVPYVPGRLGWPLVYRDRLLPAEPREDHNADSAKPELDFAAIHAAGPTARRTES